jgi:predicted ATPase/serine/threonine protein kinase
MSFDASELEAATPNALPAGTRLGEFELLSLLGVGGFGIVYLAFDHALEREVAIKEYMPASLAGRTETMHVTVRLQSDAESFALGLKSFVNEAKMLARFNHPSLLKVHRFWRANGTAYMAMPVMHGRTVKEIRLGMAGPPDEAWCRSILLPLLGAIEKLHSEGVYHRDIAPDNIQIEPDGCPVLLDFGAARHVLSDKSQALTAIVKPAYAPIEQYGETGAVRQGPWTDIYALGATLHYLLLGRPPSPATARTVRDCASNLTPEQLPGCGVAFLHTIDWMLCPRPTDRPQSVAELRDVLEGRARPPVRRPVESAPVHLERTSTLLHPSANERLDLDVGADANQYIAPIRPAVPQVPPRSPARLRRLAEPGGVSDSAAAPGVVSSRLDAAFDNLGDQSVVNIAIPVHASGDRPKTANVGTRCFRFGNIEVRYPQRLLLVDGEPATLGARAFDLLSTLIERRDRVVSKSELLKLVWRGLVVEDNNIQVQVSALRRVVGANAVATVPGYGYRFVLPVVESLAGQPRPVSPVHSVQPVVLTNLSQQPNSFIGREKEMAEIKLLFGRTRLLTLTGVGGCGKTRLALQLGADLLASYRDGVWWVDLAALVDPALVAKTVAAVMRCEDVPGKAMTQRLTDHLAAKKLLLVLDNAEHVLAACAQLAEAVLAQCSNACVLVTSREGLRAVGELTYRVPPLAAPDPLRDTTPERLMAHPSARLFFDRASLHRPQLKVTLENAPAVASICHRLDGIPLAIELAAARVRAMSVAEVNARLDHGMGMLSSGRRTAAARQQTLRSLIDWSYDLLDEPEQAMLRRLATFSGGWTLAAAEQVCSGQGIADWAVLDLLASLVDKSLVQAEDGGKTTRYGLLETMRQYAQDRMRESGDAAQWQSRHLSYFVALAEEAEPHLTKADQIDWLGRLEAEHPNIRAALSWSTEGEGDPADGLRLAGALERFWVIRGHFTEGSAWLGRLLKAEPDSQSAQYRANALRAAGQMARMQGDFAAARPYFQESLVLSRNLGDRKGTAGSLSGLGTCALNQGDYSAARALYEEALAVLRELGDRHALAPVLNNLGLVANNLRDHMAARALYEECLLIDREVGDRNAIAISLTNLGTAVREGGDAPAAVALTEEGLAIFRELGNQHDVAWSLSNLGSFACGQGRLRAARASFIECLAIRRDLGDRWGLPSSLEGLGGVEAAMNRLLRAAQLWGAAEGLRATFGIPLSPLARGKSEQNVAMARVELGDDAAFERSWQDGRAMNLDETLTYALQEDADTTDR